LEQVGAMPGEPQPDVGGAMHQARGGGGDHDELMFDSWIPTVKDVACFC
jgi:hypothetical protein